MKTKCLIISFDLIGEREPEKPLAIASLLSHAKSNQYYETNFSIEHLAINLFNHPLPDLNSILTQLENYNINSYTHLALSCYVWNEYLVNPLIHALRNNEYTGK